jgi:hypothetical protein
MHCDTEQCCWRSQQVLRQARNCPHFWNRMFIAALTTVRHCLNPVYASSCHAILFYHLRLSLSFCLFPSGMHTKIVRELLSSIRAICPAYLIFCYLLTPLIFAEEYTHTFPQLHLQTHPIMLRSVTAIHQTAILNRRAVLLLYISKVIQHIWEKCQQNFIS